MVETDGIGQDSAPGEAAAALKAILQTQYLRYLIITSWALGLLAALGPMTAGLWFVGTLAAGAARGAVEVVRDLIRTSRVRIAAQPREVVPDALDELARRIGLLVEELVNAAIGEVKQQQAVRRFAVASSATGLLIIRLDAAWDVVVNDRADV